MNIELGRRRLGPLRHSHDGAQMKLRSLALALTCLVPLVGCNESLLSYPLCPPGVSPDDYDCVLDASPGAAAAGDASAPQGADAGLADTGLVGQDDAGTAAEPGPEPGPEPEPEPEPEPDVCTPDCDDRACGSDGCGGTCGECAVGDACEAGFCTARDSGGSLSCFEVVECLQFCNTERCFDDCFNDGTAEARALYRAGLNCINENCSQLQDDIEEFGECQYERCSQELEDCFEDE